MNTLVIILAAGLGTRMKSRRPKVLHPIAGLPLVGHVLKTVENLNPLKVVGVIGRSMDGYEEEIQSLFENHSLELQDPPKGSGHGVLAAREHLKNHSGPVLIVYGDTPLLTPDTLQRLLDASRGRAGAVLAMTPRDPGHYGRLILNTAGGIDAIVEYKNATEDQRSIKICNAGAMVLEGQIALSILDQITPNPITDEIYLTDYVAIARKQDLEIGLAYADEEEVLGVNSRVELSVAEAIMQTRLRQKAMDQGVTMIAPETVTLCYDTRLGKDVTLHPGVTFGPRVIVEDYVTIKPYCVLEGATLKEHVVIGPFAHLRPGTILEMGAKVGNFVEVKASTFGAHSKASHLSYIGDAILGEKVNIGAGTITCNYDGTHKHKTIIGDGTFVRSNTALVAPVTLGSGVMIAAGSTITKDVPENSLAFGRARQVIKERQV
jgi:bifunctional UDP-N-acetylglucosamine pyrophosphorylase / glucosamine-1-phosphate N-acetyltransferase